MSKKATLADARALGYCARGMRAFVKRHGWSWSDVLRNGISVEELEKTGDYMALKVAEKARGKQ